MELDQQIPAKKPWVAVVRLKLKSHMKTKHRL
jgi:hypothetical protein